MSIAVRIEHCPLARPIEITGYRFEAVPIVVVRIEWNGVSAEGEGGPVFYLGETADRVKAQLEAIAPAIHAGTQRSELLQLLGPGAARNALDCAMWAWEARVHGRPVWQAAHLRAPRPVVSAFTLGIDTPQGMAAAARSLPAARVLKLKLEGGANTADRVRAVRVARPDARLIVDANQGWSRTMLEQLREVMTENRVEMIEQPVRIGDEESLRGLRYPIVLAADESAQDVKDLESLVGIFDMINIKLDKCGGLTRALQMARRARELGFQLMVGNMGGTSRATAPQYLLAQSCELADLDGPALLAGGPGPDVSYEEGLVRCRDPFWTGGMPEPTSGA